MTLYSIDERASKPNATIIYVDPQMARRVLAKNTRNRPLSEMHVRRLMAEMSSGRWQYNGEAIKWSTDDVLLDGQHRLTALSRLADDFPAIPFLVVRGLPTDTQNTMDQGRVRSAGDQLAIDELTSKDGKTIASAIRVYIDWTAGNLFADRRATRVSNPQVIEWAKAHPCELSIMQTILTQSLRRIKCRPALTLAIMLRLNQIDEESANEFHYHLVSGAGLESGNPILTLRERLDRIQTQRVRTSDRDFIAFFILAWNAWRQDRQMAKFQRPRGGSWSRDTFPEAI